jgi:tetratricopeptide (TPR) repeat protein
MVIPEGLRDVIGKRLSMLSADCNGLLSIASVIGRDFALDVLKNVADINEDVFVNALKEAVQMSVLEERSQLGSVRYRFTHAFFRQTMYEELIAPQRLKLHQQVARSLETQYANRIEEHASELAEHFSQSTDPADLAKAVFYGEMAAQKAISVYAYGEAVRLLEQALKVQRVLNPRDKGKVCDLLLTLGDDLITAGEPQRALSVELQEAFSLAESIGDKARAARACSLAMPGLVFHAGVNSWITPEAAQWVGRADRYADPGTVQRVWANIGLGEMKVMIGFSTKRSEMLNEGSRLLIRNVELARRLGDPEAFCFAACTRLLQASAPQHFEARLKLAEELIQKSRAGISARLHGFVDAHIGNVLLQSGERRRAQEFHDNLREAVDRTGQANLILMLMSVEGHLATLDGRLDDAIAISRDILTRGEQLGLAQFAILASYVLSFMPLLYLGRLNEMIQLFNMSPLSATPFLRANIGDQAEAAAILQESVVARPGIGSADDETPMYTDMILLHAALRVGHRPAVELLLSRFAGCRMRTTGTLVPTCIPRNLGAAAALLGRHEEARKHYDEAVKVTTEMRFRPELALTRLQLAELLLEHYPDEKADALEQLDFAIKEFREMKMQPSLERALKLFKRGEQDA